MKTKFDPGLHKYVALAKRIQNWLVDLSTACDFMACAYEKVFSNILLLKLQGKVTGCQLGKIRCQIWDRDDHGILLPKLFWSTVRKFCSSDQEKLFNAENLKKCLRSLEQFISTVKGQKFFWRKTFFLILSGGFTDLIY